MYLSSFKTLTLVMRVCMCVCVFFKSPLFILFLDCVWQMMNQYPAAFEFTEAYLTVLSDSMWIPLFSTFLFSSPKQRAQYLMVRTNKHFFSL